MGFWHPRWFFPDFFDSRLPCLTLEVLEVVSRLPGFYGWYGDAPGAHLHLDPNGLGCGSVSGLRVLFTSPEWFFLLLPFYLTEFPEFPEFPEFQRALIQQLKDLAWYVWYFGVFATTSGKWTYPQQIQATIGFVQLLRWKIPFLPFLFRDAEPMESTIGLWRFCLWTHLWKGQLHREFTH